MIFIDNKYSVWYFNIINNALSRQENIGYIEKHHIVPNALGGSNKINNIVALTAKEHFICHLLLPKFTVGENKKKMNYALWMMINAKNNHQQTNRYVVNSTYYLILKERLSKIFSDQHKGKKLSEEHKRKISETRKKKIAEGTLKVNENKEKYKLLSEKMKGRKQSDETKKKIGDAHKGKTISKEHKERLVEAHTGLKVSSDTKKKISSSMKEQYKNGKRVPWNKGKKYKLNEL